MGQRNLINFTSPSHPPASKASTKVNGNSFSSIGGMNRLRCALQKSPDTKVSTHHARHLSKVRLSIPSSSRNRCTLASLTP